MAGRRGSPYGSSLPFPAGEDHEFPDEWTRILLTTQRLREGSIGINPALLTRTPSSDPSTTFGNPFQPATVSNRPNAYAVSPRSGRAPALLPAAVVVAAPAATTQNGYVDPDETEVEFLESDEDPDADTIKLHVPVVPDESTEAARTSKKRKASNSGSDSEYDDDDNINRPAPRRVQRPPRSRRRTSQVVRGARQSTVPTRTSRASSTSDPTLGGRGSIWSAAERASAIRHMSNIMDNELTNGLRGEARFRETARLMHQDGFPRDFGGVKNMWNRCLRAESGRDERRKQDAPLATSKQDRATKNARQKRLAKARAEGRTKPTRAATKRRKLDEDADDEQEETGEESEEESEEDTEEEADIKEEDSSDDEEDLTGREPPPVDWYLPPVEAY